MAEEAQTGVTIRAPPAAPATTTPTVKNRQRDPPLFAGTPDSDVHDWLKTYERASLHNRWDDSFKLANVFFFLKDTALKWFENHEEEINSWDAFKATFANAFGKPEQRKQQAKDKLASRYQANTESSTSYIEDVLRLCSRVDPEMPEDDRIRHLFKGLSQELFTIVAPKSPPTVQQLIDECKKYEELQSARIAKAPFERLPEVCLATASSTDIATLIRTIIRDELRPYLAHLTPAAALAQEIPQVKSMQQVVQQEIRAALGHLALPTAACPPAPSAPPLICSMPQDSYPRYCRPAVQQTPQSSRPYGPRRRTEIWRTEDNRPICYHCHTPGHIARYCRHLVDTTMYRPLATGTSRTFRNEAHPSDDRHDPRTSSPITNRRGRSPSPYPRRPRSVSPLNAVAEFTETSN